MSLKPGIYPKIAASDYHADPCSAPSLSSSIAAILLQQSPAHAHAAHPKLGGHRRPATASMTEGSLLHALLLGDADSIAIIDVKDWRTKAAKVWKAATIANGVSPVLKHEHDAALVLAERLRDKFLERGYDIREFAHEVTIVWDETASDGTKVRCRGRVDALDLETARILDLKSTASAGATGIAKSCISYGYDVQHAAYVSAIETLRPELAGRVEYDWLFFETTPPYAVTPATPDGTMRELGESKWRRAVEIWAHCLRSATWPEYTAEKIFVPAPMWALRQELGTDAAEY